MFLKQLSISIGSNIIREINFRKGLNLIVDETKTSDKRESGNNVGKTTVIRLIDFCFGGDGKNIYKDPEFKDKANNQIERFLKDNNVLITMTLKDNLEIISSREIVIRRNFLSRNKKILEINGEKQKADEFEHNLKYLIFKSKHEKPKLRQIIAKNIRDGENRVSNTLKVLSPYTTIEEYESLFLFWLGIELDTNARKQQLIRNQTIENNLLNRLKRETSLPQITQSLIVIERTISELTKKKDSFDINHNYENELNKLNLIKSTLNELSTSVSVMELRKNLIIESKIELENEFSVVDEQQIKSVYEQAKLYIPVLQKTFEETLIFHNKNVQGKLEYIVQEMPELELNISLAKTEISKLLLLENNLAQELKKSDIMKELQLIITNLNKAFEKKGILIEQKRLMTMSIKKLNEIEKELSQINEGIDSKDKLLNNRIEEFNKYFSDMSSQLYGEQFILSPEKHEKGYQLNISSLSGNLGTGKKKGQIAAFDLAYIQFADKQGIKCLHFVFQDQIENVHDNQINNILSEIVANVNCQYILPVLRDKLPVNFPVDEYKIVSLSQSDKLFRQ